MTAGSPLVAALKGLCPRCAAPGLFDGLVKFAPTCRACGLDFASFNVGDGPAAFLILIVGAIVTGGAIWVELAFTPAWWVHLMWVPVAALLTVVGLRLGKAALLALEYTHSAREGRIGR
ncbi:MAG: DUF983 domain-containing protein [Sphingomicrobium sp.]